jgi:hypothetical protein
MKSPSESGADQQPLKSSLPLLLGWFVFPITALIVLEWFHVFERIPRWLGLE